MICVMDSEKSLLKLVGARSSFNDHQVIGLNVSAAPFFCFSDVELAAAFFTKFRHSIMHLSDHSISNFVLSL